MAFGKKAVADAFFWIQIACAVLFGIVQSHRMLTTAQGVSMTWFSCWDVFLLINLAMAVAAHRNQPSRVTWQTVFVYAAWTLMVSLAFGVQMVKGETPWSLVDTVTVGIAGGGILCALAVAAVMKLGIGDPMVRGCIALLFKAVPQFTMAYNVLHVGGQGIAGIMMVSGHVAILTRVGQLCFSIREAGWDRNRTGSFVSEAANEVSWLACTIAVFLH